MADPYFKSMGCTYILNIFFGNQIGNKKASVEAGLIFQFEGFYFGSGSISKL
jgi:hypothetical protein